ncbi:conserved hypothetical protein [Bradyrhizobium sp. ORS 278]|uniref:hypothetical protein n=1 Tax=Bradyrhizobium sp. (strain ORS 278) TaxID=114615 RepID=UPI0001508EB2|nr:hypothetical protein [Bradyrhizobium sp. ORS 278]CAL78986.1 conserved hypothetical protein [Bradyrhizobium sp. ORS 278]
MAIDPALLRKELDALTRELSQLLGDRSRRQNGLDSSPILEPVAAAISALGAGLSNTDVELERLVRKRPITATLAAFSVGMVVGFILRRS